VKVRVEQSIIDDSTDQWHRRLHVCIWTTGGHFKYSLWHKLVKTLLTGILLLNETLVSDYRQFPDIYLPQRCVGMCLRCGGIFLMITSLHTYCSSNGEVFCKSVNIWQSYGQEYGVLVIWFTVYKQPATVMGMATSNPLISEINRPFSWN